MDRRWHWFRSQVDRTVQECESQENYIGFLDRLDKALSDGCPPADDVKDNKPVGIDASTMTDELSYRQQHQQQEYTIVDKRGTAAAAWHVLCNVVLVGALAFYLYLTPLEHVTPDAIITQDLVAAENNRRTYASWNDYEASWRPCTSVTCVDRDIVYADLNEYTMDEVRFNRTQVEHAQEQYMIAMNGSFAALPLHLAGEHVNMHLPCLCTLSERYPRPQIHLYNPRVWYQGPYHALATVDLPVVGIQDLTVNVPIHLLVSHMAECGHQLLWLTDALDIVDIVNCMALMNVRKSEMWQK